MASDTLFVSSVPGEDLDSRKSFLALDEKDYETSKSLQPFALSI